MLTATGNINQNYAAIGVVHASVARTPMKGGCGQSKGIPVDEAYREATAALVEAAKLSGGDAVIHIGYDHRMATRQMGCNNVEPLFEVYAWGTAVKLG
jgi:uncharacterized protein YbjQ (UPF0145 family)